jgi:hypothetical protein
MLPGDLVLAEDSFTGQPVSRGNYYRVSEVLEREIFGFQVFRIAELSGTWLLVQDVFTHIPKVSVPRQVPGKESL